MDIIILILAITIVILTASLIFFCFCNKQNYTQYLDDNAISSLLNNKIILAKLNQIGKNHKKFSTDERHLDGLWWCNKTLPNPRHFNNPSNGLCFSGGGVVAMVYTAGYLRGLLQSKILNDKNIRHITGSSGATWVLTPCAYVNAFKDILSLESILGEYKIPSDLNLKDMETISPLPFIGNCGTKSNLSDLITRIILNLSPMSQIPVSQIFTDAIARLILEPLKLYYGTSTVVQLEREQSVSSQPLLKESFTEYGNAFYLRPSFPFTHFLITAMNAPDAKLNYRGTRFPLEMTPSQIGCLSEDIEFNNISIGGQIINYCFGGYNTEGQIPIKNNSGTMSTTIENKWFMNGIEKYIGYPSSLWSYWFLKEKYLSQFVSKVKLNLPNSYKDLIDTPYLGDGGYYDSCGICALLARQVKHIYVFMMDGCLKPNINSPDEGSYPITLQQIFGYEVGKYKSWGPGFIEDDSSHSKFWNVATNLSANEWEPAIYTSKYVTKEIPEAGITPYTVEISFIIPSKTLEYQTQLSVEIQEKIEQIPDYPQYIVPPKTLNLIKLSPFEINAAMNLAAYTASNYISQLIFKDQFK